MKVLQIIDSLPATSGGSRFVVNLTKKLNVLEIETSLLLIDGKKSHFTEEIVNNNINLIALDNNTSSRYKLKYIKQVANIMDNYDIIHVHVFPASYLVALASLFTKKKPKIVFTEHNAYNRRATNFIFKYLEKLIYSRFKRIIGITPEVKKFIHRYITTDNNKVGVIINGVDIENIELSINPDREDYHLNREDVICLMAARFSYQKDQETLIKAFQNLPSNFKLLFAGDGENLMNCKKLVKELNLENKIIFLGSRSDIYSIIKMSDINILSSRYEGFGLSIVEAMALSKPVIGTNVDGMNKVIEGAGLLLK